MLGMTGCSDDGAPISSTASSDSGDPAPLSTSTGIPPADDTHDWTGSSFLRQPDLLLFECDLFAQDCSEGKCTLWGSDGGEWDASRCRPVVAEPAGAGEPCHVEGSRYSGIDDCDFGAICLIDEIGTLEGTCVPFCVGSASGPLICEDPDRTCVTANNGSIIFCLPACNPLQADCPDGQGCYPYTDDWLCGEDASGDLGAYGDPCDFFNVCDPGLICLGAAAVPPGEACEDTTGGCCTEVCDVTDPAGDLQCAGVAGGQLCVPWYEESMTPPPGLENVGACSLPP
jgi:hypothetical protein